MASKDRKQLRARIARFMQQYGRKARKGLDPNDRTYDREIEKLVKRMDPEELDRILREEDEPGTPPR